MRSAKRLLLIVWFILLALVMVTPASQRPASGNELYRQNCRICHEKGSPDGEYSPMSLIQDQWKEFFETKFVNTHKEVQLPGQSKKLLDMITPEQIKTIKKFCIDHAADSEQPQTCS